MQNKKKKKTANSTNKEFPSYNFVLSHNEHNGYDYYGKMNEIINNKTSEKAISYITKFTEKYASNMRFISSNSNINALFEIDGYVFIIKAYSMKDSRSFIEKKVTVIDTNNRKYNNLPISKYLKTDCVIESYYDDSLLKYFRLSTLLTAFSERSRMFILIKNDDNLSNAVFNAIYRYIPNAITQQIPCTETFCDFVDIDSRIYICRCLNNFDYNIFKDYINNQKKCYQNISVVDFYSKGMSINIDFENPTISSECIMRTITRPKSLNVNEIVKKYTKLPKSNLQAYYDTITFLTLYRMLPNEIKNIKGCRQDIDNIYKCLTRGAE